MPRITSQGPQALGPQLIRPPSELTDEELDREIERLCAARESQQAAPAQRRAPTIRTRTADAAGPGLEDCD